MSAISSTFFFSRLMVNYIAIKIGQFLHRILPHKKMAVTIGQGTLIGLQYKTRLSNKPYFSFLGVPYAKPPINDLRFKPPVEHPGWSGEFNAFSEGDKCIQYPLAFNIIVGSEDCLYLNIFVPQEEHGEKKAVMVFIHGGAFINGSGSMVDLSPDNLLDENVIVVTFNYRLNVIGFLNFDIDECPGNMGLKDQRLAIKWVKENISAFGGDADNITVFGTSAGSASVYFHTLSPQSTGLFQKAITQSGNMFDSWAINKNHREAAFTFAKNLGCEKDDPKDIVRYLKTVPAIDLLKYSYLNDKTDYLLYPFIPSIECDTLSCPFLSADPQVLIKTAIPVPMITGLNDMEGILTIGGTILFTGIERLGDIRTIEGVNTFLKVQFSEETVAKIWNFYFNDRNLENKTTILENIVHLQSDMFFVKTFHRAFEHLLKQKVTPVYNYEFKFHSKINAVKKLLLHNHPIISQSLKGACHGDELNYLFYMPVLGYAPKPDSSELQMCRTISKLWTNFAKTGNPNSPDLSFEWKYTSEDHPKYLSINGDSTKMVDGLLYGSRVKLWEDISNISLNPQLKSKIV